MTTRLTLAEGGPAVLVPLADPVAEALASAQLRCTRTAGPGMWEVAAGTSIGVVSIGDLQVVIQPKIPIQRLVFLMGYARNPSFWRGDPVQLDAAPDLAEALAATFARLAARALDQGLLKGYRTVDESLPVMRGRIREADQLRRRWGRLMPLEVRYDDYTVDIAENQILAGAVDALLRLPIHPALRPALLRLRLLLADVTPARGPRRPSWRPSRLNVRYHAALRLAELILDGWSFEQRVGEVQMSGYLFNMATVFEEFVTVALGEAMRPFGGRSASQYSMHLDAARRVPIRPDYVWSRGGIPAVVADAKYKAEKPSGFPQADLYQMLAYVTVLGLDRGHLVYARGNEQGAVHRVVNSNVVVVAHTLDLESAPPLLLDEVAAIAGEMVGDAPPARDPLAHPA